MCRLSAFVYSVQKCIPYPRNDSFDSMQIRFSQLKNHLSKSSAVVFLVSGDEPYQHMLAVDQIRKNTKQVGFTERKIFTVESGFDWSELESAKNNLSLFAERILIDLRIPTGKPGAAGSKAIVKFIQSMHDDIALLIQVPRMDRNVLNSAWVKAVDKAGVILRVWPLNEIETKNLIAQKLKAKEFNFAPDIVNFIFQQVEGNLLAAVQEIEKLALLSESKKLDILAVNKALTNSSHYSLNELMDVVVKRDQARLIRIVQGLKKEDNPPPLLLWGLTEQIRKQSDVRRAGRESKNMQAHILAQPKGLLNKIAVIHQQQHHIEGYYSGANLLKQCSRVDRVIKGRASGNVWDELLQLSLAAQLVA